MAPPGYFKLITKTKYSNIKTDTAILSDILSLMKYNLFLNSSNILGFVENFRVMS